MQLNLVFHYLTLFKYQEKVYFNLLSDPDVSKVSMNRYMKVDYCYFSVQFLKEKNKWNESYHHLFKLKNIWLLPIHIPLFSQLFFYVPHSSTYPCHNYSELYSSHCCHQISINYLTNSFLFKGISSIFTLYKLVKLPSF